MGYLESLIPDDLKRTALLSGHELVFPYAEALRAIAVASAHQIAVLGLEAFEVQKEGLLTVDMADASAYIPFSGDWPAYVRAMNTEAEHWIREHRLGENHGYILSSASESEFASLRHQRK